MTNFISKLILKTLKISENPFAIWHIMCIPSTTEYFQSFEFEVILLFRNLKKTVNALKRCLRAVDLSKFLIKTYTTLISLLILWFVISYSTISVIYSCTFIFAIFSFSFCNYIHRVSVSACPV